MNTRKLLMHNKFSLFDVDNAQILKQYSVAGVENLKKDISITKLNTIITNTKRAKPVLKANIGDKCIIEGKPHQTLVIIHQDQELPYTNSVKQLLQEIFKRSVHVNSSLKNQYTA